MDNIIQITSLEQVPQGITLLFEKIANLERELLKRDNSSPAQAPPAQAEYLTRTQVKDLLKISYPTLRAWTTEGKVKGYRISGRIRYKASEIDAALTAIKPATAIA